ncbi:hypothetical protein TWF128_000120 [Orbilia oligospora]|nr:hypothetical protein TWF128_000120 [Orbilia oligospora]
MDFVLSVNHESLENLKSWANLGDRKPKLQRYTVQSQGLGNLNSECRSLQLSPQLGYHSIPRIRALGLALMQRGLHVGAQA